STLRQQYDRLNATGSGVGQQSAMDPAVQRAVVDAKRQMDLVAKDLPGALAGMVSEVANRREAIVSNEARNELTRRYEQQIVKDCRELIEGRYPVRADSPTDVPLGDFGHVFGPGGVFDTFYHDNLAQVVDNSTSPWRWRPGSAAGPESMLVQFQRV